MKKKIFILLVLSVFLMRPIFSIASIEDTISYLKSQDQTSWVTQALVALGETDIESEHLKTVPGSLSTDYAKAIMGITALGENPKSFGNIDYVSKLRSYYSNGQMGDTGLINDDMWAILAFASALETGDEISGAKDYILQNQNNDGGWSYMVDGESDTNDTAAAIIALIEAGVSKTDPAITNAKNYLKNVQNSDGGFGWTNGSNSDSGSDAWVIIALNKLDEDLSSWESEGFSPLDHLMLLKDSDGAYWWVAPGTSDFNNKAMTPYVAIAISGESFPVKYYVKSIDSGYKIRIEGESQNICDTKIEGNTAMDLIEKASTECLYTYVIDDTSYGPYLSQINEEAAAGMKGWMYYVNNESLAIGAADYIMAEGDEVLFYYGEWGMKPSRLMVENSEIGSGESVDVKVEYYEDGSWKVLDGAMIKLGEALYYTDANGELVLSPEDGVYELFAEKEGYIRTRLVAVTVGSGVTQSVSLSVEIEQPDIPIVGGESLIFEVTPGELNFGKIRPGENSEDVLTIKNEGTVDLVISSSVSGDQIFGDNITVNNSSWADYIEQLDNGENKDLNVGLSIPSGYLNEGVKLGEIIFWAKPK